MAFHLLAAGLKRRICPKKPNPFPPIPCNPPVRRHKGFIVRLGLALFLLGLLKGNKAEARRPVGWSAKLLIFRTCGAGAATLTTQQAHKYLMFSAGRGSGKSVLLANMMLDTDSVTRYQKIGSYPSCSRQQSETIDPEEEVDYRIVIDAMDEIATSELTAFCEKLDQDINQICVINFTQQILYWF